MAVFKCKMCGANLEISENQSVVTCEYCNTQQTLPKFDDDRKITLFTRANHLRFNCEFDKAAGVYESIVTEFPDESEAYWGLVLCKYGIEYVGDSTGKRIPTCHRTLPISIMDDDDFQQAYEYADITAKNIYRQEAKVIDAIQKKILDIALNESPYDIFICYKENDDVTGNRTEDSLVSQDIYTELVKQGYKVFFSRVTLRDVAGKEYEPYIYAALSSAKIMLAIGTKYEYYDAVWVKNEWSRFISMMGDDSSKALIPCFKNMDAYDMPKEFKNMQALDMGEVTFFASLTANINKFIANVAKKTTKAKSDATGSGATVESLLKRAFMFLEDGDFARADEFCEQVLNIDPENAQAYLGKLMVDYKVKKQNDLRKLTRRLDNNINYRKAYRFADKELKVALDAYRKDVVANITEQIFSKAVAAYNTSNEPFELLEIASTFEKISGYKNSVELMQLCREKARKISKLEETERIKAEKEREIKNEKIFHLLKISAIILGGIAVITAFAMFISSLITEIKSDVEGVYSGQYVLSDSVDIVPISVGPCHTVGLKSDGTVVAAGFNQSGQCDVSDWTDIVAISAGGARTVGLKSDGTVVAIGSNYYGQCDVGDWTDIVAVSVGDDHTVGLKSDGTVGAIGSNIYGQCDVSDWTDIITICAGDDYTVGLKSDGTVVAVGDNAYGQCDVSAWTDIVAIYTSTSHTVGLKSDGKIVAVGNNKSGQCNVSDWTDIAAVSASDDHTVGLESDGTVVAVGNNKSGQCNVSDWKDIVAVSASDDRTVGLKSDGTVVAVGDSLFGQCDVSDWTDIVAIYANSFCTVGLKSDGTVVAVGDNPYGQCDVSDWKNIKLPENTSSNNGSVLSTNLDYNNDVGIQIPSGVVQVTSETSTTKHVSDEKIITYIPDLKGKSYDDIKNNKEYIDVFVFKTEYIDSVEERGAIISQDKAPGKKVGSDEPITIKLTISNGLPIPKLEGKNVDDAVQELGKLGFKSIKKEMGKSATNFNDVNNVYLIAYEDPITGDWEEVTDDNRLSANDTIILFYYS